MYSLFDSIPQCTCVYKITNKINNKSIIGSTKNLNKRINHYRNDIKKENPLKHYNKDFLNDIIDYGLNSFYLEIIEEFDNISDIELKNKESFYINKFDTLNNGYNIRLDIDGKYICNNSTKALKSLQTKEQWLSGVRDSHSYKMKNYWKTVSDDRKIQQSNIMSKNLTKYAYDIYDTNNKLIVKNGSYIDLKELHIESVIGNFAKNTNKNNIINNKIILNFNNSAVAYCKGYKVIRHYIK